MTDISGISPAGLGGSKPSSTVFSVVSRKVIILGSVCIVGIMTVIAYINTDEKTAARRAPITSNVDPNARRAKPISENAPNTSPVKQQKIATEKKENLAAKEDTNSHVKDAILLDSTPQIEINKDSAALVEAEVPTVTLPDPPAKVVTPPPVEKKPVVQAKPPQPEVPRDVRIRQGVELLTSFNSPYLPEENNVGQLALKKFSSHIKGIKSSDIYANTGDGNGFKTDYGIEAIKQQAVEKQQQQQQQNSGKEAAANTTAKRTEIKPEDYLMQFGDSVMATVLAAFSTDFSLPVVAEIWQPPLEKVRVEGGYEWDEYENGIVLRFKRLYPENQNAIQIDAFGVDVEGENTPLFDQDVDRHYWIRFWSRASAAFIAPWLDFATTTSQIINSGEVIEVVNPVASTTDKVIGSIGNIAKEFLPEMARNSERKPTANLPQGYPVKLVFLKPLVSLDPKDTSNDLSNSANILNQNSTDVTEDLPSESQVPRNISEIKRNVISSIMNKGN